MAVDVVITSCDRFELLEKTIQYLLERTATPYRLFVIDDGSQDPRILDLLSLLYDSDLVHYVHMRPERTGQRANIHLAYRLTASDPVVLVDDDILCPLVVPDWLSRGLNALKRDDRLGMLALNHPGAKRKDRGSSGSVTYCKSLGGTYLFVRRAVLASVPYPERPGDFGRAIEPLCVSAREAGWKLGYLTGTFCYHTGRASVQDGQAYKGKFIEPKDWETLEPEW